MKINRLINFFTISLAIVLLPVMAQAQNEQTQNPPAGTTAAPANPYGMTHAMGQMFNPQMYANMMNLMFSNPAEMMTNPMAMCAQCHDGEEMARYSKSMGPMMAMMNPGNWMNPMAYMQMMTPMMDPQTYTEWYNAMMGKAGNMATGGIGSTQ